jgi:predicted NBD/HSP70 family sugar kinase
MNKITSPDLMKINNRRRILEIIYTEKNIYRAQIAEMTNMSNQTITNLVKELINEGMVEEITLENKALGRNPMALSIRYHQLCSIGVEISVESINAGLYDAAGNGISKLNIMRDMNRNVIDVLKEVIDKIIKSAEDLRILGIAISIEGIVDDKNGVVIKSKNLGLDGISILSELEYLDIPVQIKNDVNILAETDYGREQTNNYMLIKLGGGIGAALVLNGNLLRSTNNAAGEFGHVRLYSIDSPKTCKCGQKGCLTTEASITAIEEKAGMTIEELARLYQDGDLKARGIIKEIAGYISEPLTNMIAILDLDKVIFTGKLVECFGDRLTCMLEKNINQNLNKWSSFKGIGVLNDYNITGRCAHYVVNNFFLKWKDETYD